jgi:outer membrane protein assembly factor BamD
MILKLVAGIYLLFSMQSAFAFFGSEERSTPSSLLETALVQLEKAKFSKAVKSLDEIITNFPDFENIKQVKVLLADAYYGDKKYHYALKLYEGFHLENPFSEDGAHTLFRMGLCNLQFIKKGKGQKFIPYAVAAFERFVNLYPEDLKVHEAIKNIAFAKKAQAEYQIEVGNYYFKHKDYCAAFNHFEKIYKLEDYGTYKTVNEYISSCQKLESCLNEVAACEFELTEVNSRFR